MFSPSWYLTGELEKGQSPFAHDQAYSHLKGNKADEPWLHEVPSQVYRNAMYQRKQAWMRHYDNPREVGVPGRRIKGINDSVLLTKEIFRWLGDGKIEIGTKSNTVGVLTFHHHRECGIPGSITISHDADGRWWVSFNFDNGVVAVEPEAVLSRLAKMPDAEIESLISAHDVGVVRSVTCSNGKVFQFGERKLAKIAKWKRRISKRQRKLTRQKKGSKRRAKNKRRIARLHSKIRDVRNDHCHQESHQVVEHSAATIVSFEKLNLRGMVRRPKVIKNEDGTGHAPNGAARKAGLNTAILNQSWGTVIKYSRYKAPRCGKLVVTVSPYNSSQECSCCGHTAPANRPSQAEFHCQACGFIANADDNASAVLKKRTFALILGVLGRRTDITPAEAATKLGLKLKLAAIETGIRSTKLAA